MPTVFSPFIKARAQAEALMAEYDDRLTVLTKQHGDITYSAGVAGQRATAYQQELDDLVADIANDDTQLAAMTPGTERHTSRTNERRKRNDRR